MTKSIKAPEGTVYWFSRSEYYDNIELRIYPSSSRIRFSLHFDVMQPLQPIRWWRKTIFVHKKSRSLFGYDLNTWYDGDTLEHVAFHSVTDLGYRSILDVFNLCYKPYSATKAKDNLKKDLENL